MSELPELIGERVVLTQFSASDITDDYIGWLNDLQVVRYSNQRFFQHTRESAFSYFVSFSGSCNHFISIKLKGNNFPIGTMTAYKAQQHGTADIGLLIGDKRYWGKGFGLDAWKLLLNYLLEQEGVRKVTGGTLRVNIAMLRIMERTGMQLEAVRRDQEMVEGVPCDTLYYAKFRANY